MTKLMRIRDKLLLGLAFTGDALEAGRDPFNLLSLAYSSFYGFVPSSYKKSNFELNLKRLQRTGFIEKIKYKGEPYLRLTSAGRDNLYRDFPLFSLQKRRWDGKWRVVIFDIEEKKRGLRNILRVKLKELGFGMIQQSVWISPHDFIHDFREFLEEHYLGKAVFVLEVKVLLAGDQKMLTNKIWRLDRLNTQYERLYYRLKDKNVDRGKIWQEFCDVLFDDPLLPKELLPVPWYGFLIRSLLTNN